MTDGRYLNEDGQVVVALLPPDLHALLLAQIHRTDLLVTERNEVEGYLLDWDALNVMLSWSGYLPPSDLKH